MERKVTLKFYNNHALWGRKLNNSSTVWGRKNQGEVRNQKPSEGGEIKSSISYTPVALINQSTQITLAQ